MYQGGGHRGGSISDARERLDDGFPCPPRSLTNGEVARSSTRRLRVALFLGTSDRRIRSIRARGSSPESTRPGRQQVHGLPPPSCKWSDSAQDRCWQAKPRDTGQTPLPPAFK